MNLREYLRAEWGQYIRPLIIKDKCEFCGSEEDLHLHHIDKFYNMLMETLEELQLQELDTEDYTKEELNLISHLMLSKQIRSKYKTLCKKCHKKEHMIEGKVIYNEKQLEDKEKKIKERELYIQNILKPYLDSIVGKKLFKEEQKELIEKINLRVDGRQQKSYSKLNDGLKMIKLGFIILPKRTSKERYWVVEKCGFYK